MGAVGLGALLAEAQDVGGARPNFVFVLADDLGWADLGCYGSKYHETPNLDRLAADGMRFTDAYAACPVCSPTRASLLSGKWPARLRLTNFLVGEKWPKESPLTKVDWVKQLDPNEVTIAEILREAGYVTGHLGKWHLGEQSRPEDQGFDENVAGGKWGTPPSYFSPYKNSQIKDGPAGEYLTDRLGAEAAEFIKRHKDRPFMLNVWHYGVHIPLRGKAELIEKYRKKAGVGGQDNPVYAAMMESLDDSVGAILAALKEAGVEKKTVVIFTSDNGGLSVAENGPRPTSNAPLRSGKGYLYEGGIRVPLIVRWPGVLKAGSASEQVVSSVDFLPTLMSMAGVKSALPKDVDGTNMVPAMKGVAAAQRTIYWHYPHYANQGGPPGGAVRSGDWKLIEWYEDGKVELFNLKEDIGETNDLSGKMPEVRNKLRVQFEEWRRKVGAQMPGRKEQ
jgi:arylsulfatase A-like enzyme